MGKSVFCDESGFSGDNLQDAAQPYFVYAGVVIEPEEASHVLQSVRALVGTKAAEFKGSDLFKHKKAVAGVEYLVAQFTGRAALVAHEKAYALACKFFEYALEPALAERNSFYYQRNFHRFIANALYLYVRSGDQDAVTALTNFLQLMSRKAGQTVEGIYSASLPLSMDPASIVTDILRLARSAPFVAAVQDELSTISEENGRIKWFLDLSVPSAVSVLRALSVDHGALRVTLDDSKPLVAYASILNDLGSRGLVDAPKEFGVDLPLNFILDGPVQFGDSHHSDGLQLADLIAGTVASALKAGTPAAVHILDLFAPLVCAGSIGPVASAIDLTSAEAELNAVLLRMLVERAETGKSLVDFSDRYQ